MGFGAQPWFKSLLSDAPRPKYKKPEGLSQKFDFRTVRQNDPSDIWQSAPSTRIRYSLYDFIMNIDISFLGFAQ